MSGSASRIINALPDIESKRYLELGVGKQNTFVAVRAGHKVGVDRSGGEGICKTTTDEFFASQSEQFDIVFIDADHDYPQALRDFNNSVACCPEGLIFLHDMVPPSEAFTAHHLCSDSYRLLYGLLYRGQRVKVLDSDFGLTVVQNPVPLVPDDSWGNLPYAEFAGMALPLLSEAEIIFSLTGRHVGSRV